MSVVDLKFDFFFHIYNFEIFVHIYRKNGHGNLLDYLFHFFIF